MRHLLVRTLGNGWIFTCLLLVLPSLSWAEISSGDHANPPKDSVEGQLKAAVEDAQKNMPGLESWQKTLFADEVVPQFQRFVQDYRPSGEGLKVVVDIESLKHYLVFYGPKAFKQPNPKIVVYVKADSQCAKCMESAPAVTRLLKARVERRGMIPVWVGSDELGPRFNDKMVGTELEEFVVSLSKRKNAVGAMIVRLMPAPIDDIDTAHADEKRYLLRTYLQMGDVSTQNRQKELLDNDTFENSEARLLTDIFADIGAKFELQQSVDLDSGKVEVLIEVSGIQDFAQYTRVKTLMSAQLKDIYSLEDRILSKEQVVFAVFTKKTTEDLRTQLSRMNLDPGSPQPLVVVVR